MGTIIKLFIAAVILNAAAQIGLAEYKYYKFQDALHESLLFAINASDADITKMVMSVAEENDVPLEVADVSIVHERTELKITTSYDEDVALVPGLYSKNWTFNPATSVKVFGAGRLTK